MKSVLKKLLIGVFILLIFGLLFCIYVMQAPPLAEPGDPKLQTHVRTAFRKRPTVNSQPIGDLRNKHLYSLDTIYLSNLNSGIFSKELLFNAVLGVRARYNAQLMDKEITTGFDWQKMFADSAAGIRLNSKKTTINVVLSGKNWLLTDDTGAGYSIQKVGDELEIYLPDLIEAFENNRTTLSDDIKFSIVKPGKQWLITDNKYLQSYEIRSSNKNLAVYQQSKYPIQTLMFKVDLVSQITLPEGKLPDELHEGFDRLNIPLSKNAIIIQEEDGLVWKVTDGTQKYTIQNEDGLLKVFLDLDSGWLLVKVNNKVRGWVQSERGTIFLPPPPALTSRQQLKENMRTFFTGLKSMVSVSKQNDP